MSKKKILILIQESPKVTTSPERTDTHLVETLSSPQASAWLGNDYLQLALKCCHPPKLSAQPLKNRNRPANRLIIPNFIGSRLQNSIGMKNTDICKRNSDVRNRLTFHWRTSCPYVASLSSNVRFRCPPIHFKLAGVFLLLTRSECRKIRSIGRYDQHKNMYPGIQTYIGSRAYSGTINTRTSVQGFRYTSHMVRKKSPNESKTYLEITT
jgi:hypothetical protein